MESVFFIILIGVTGLMCQPQKIDDGECGADFRDENWQGKPKYSEKTCPSATLCTTNPTYDLGFYPVLRGRRPATNRLSYGADTSRSLS
jgi:hypothetical protein